MKLTCEILTLNSFKNKKSRSFLKLLMNENDVLNFYKKCFRPKLDCSSGCSKLSRHSSSGK